MLILLKKVYNNEESKNRKPPLQKKCLNLCKTDKKLFGNSRSLTARKSHKSYSVIFRKTCKIK